MRLSRTTLALSLLVTLSPAPLRAQCPSWSAGFHEPGPDEVVNAMTVFDGGGGPALYIGGDFTYVGAVAAKRVAKWDGTTWTALGDGLGDEVHALAAFNGELYAAGSFVHAGGDLVLGVARWDGSDWLPLGGGVDLAAAALAVFDDGSGPALYVGGYFNYAFNGGVSVASQGVARWDGASWSSVGGGVGLNVQGFAIFDDGNGAALYAGGYTGGASSPLMKWDGATWTPIPTPLVGGSALNALTVHDDGSGPALFAGGDFDDIFGVGAHNIAKWNGVNWSPLGSGISGNSVNALASYDDGSGPKLFAGGWFTGAGGTNAANVARWDGASWAEVGGGTNSTVFSLSVFDSGNGARLWAGGFLESAGSLALSHMAGWDGASWSSADPTGQGVHVENLAAVRTLAELDDGSGPALYAAGYFKHVGSVIANSIARWDGTSWTPLGVGASFGALALATFDDGGGTAIFAAGGSPLTIPLQQYGIAKWDGSSWTQVGGGVTGSSGNAASAFALAVFDDGSGPALFTGGNFTFAGGVSANRIAKWDGASWHALGSGMNSDVHTLVVFDDGFGPALYAGGTFLNAGGVAVNHVAKWDGANWSALGDGFDHVVWTLAVHDDGGGPALYAGGMFQNSGATSAKRIARWNGTSWSALGSGMNDTVETLTSFDDGFGPALFAGGQFTTAGGLSAKRIAKWNGASWSPLAGGLGAGSATCFALAVFHDGIAPQGSLYAGGSFESADDLRSTCIARWTNACACTATSYCTSGVTSNGCVPAISGTGTPSVSATSGFTISVASVEGQKQGHIFYGITGPLAASWGASSHFLCVKAPTQRTGTQDSGGTAGACNGSIALDWNTYCATHPGALGQPFSAGQSVWAQLYFRDPPGPKTTALSNALTFAVCP